MGMMIIVGIFCAPGYLMWHLIWFISGRDIRTAEILTRVAEAVICVLCMAVAIRMGYGYFVAKVVESYDPVMLMAGIGIYILFNVCVLNNHLNNHINGETY